MRTRLAAGLQPEWNEAPHGEDGHDVALDVLEELIASSGYGPWDGGHRPRVRLDDITTALATDQLVADMGAMADAIPGLSAAIQAGCMHSPQAARLLQALIDHDVQVWPVHLARHHYSGTARWRARLDAIVADRALTGRADDLWHHVNAFTHVAEDLRGILNQLAILADTPERAMIAHDLWPQLLDRLLPGERNLEVLGGRKRFPNHRDVKELDEALLLAPPKNVQWPWDRTLQLLLRWTGAFEETPRVADRLILVLTRLGNLTEPAATALILSVLGTHLEAIERESDLVVAWLRFVLVDHPEPVGDRRQVRTLLDGLAARGDNNALALQQQIEA